ncbi:MAG: hypothetical protein ACLTAZ_10605 [Dysosmobacter welbionis]|uniref:hypothetical protein n=1 Tax=Dysosmobacter welbionis TaxID=2093857 RepID=UPI00399456A5
MLKYIIKRILWIIPILIGVTIVVFTILYFSPGDPAYLALGDNATPEAVEAYRIEMGINGTYWERLGRTLLGLFQGDLGNLLPLQNSGFERTSRALLCNIQYLRMEHCSGHYTWNILRNRSCSETEHHSGLSVHRVRFIWNFHADVLAGPDADSDFLRWTGLASGFGLRE